MSLKKTIRPEEWDELEKRAKEDSNGSISRVFDILRKRRIDEGVELLNWSWFKSFMMHVCHCRDGKLAGFVKPKSSDRVVKEEKPVIEQPEVKETPVVKIPQDVPSVEQHSTESMSELLKSDTIFVLKWLYHNGKTTNFHNLITHGISKAKVEKCVKELLSYGILVKKNSRRFEPIDWDQLIKDFPEILEVYTPEQEKMMLQTKKKSSVTSPVSSVPPAPIPEKKSKKKMTDMEKAVDWLLNEPHVKGEFTKSELIQFLRIIGVKDSYSAADKVLCYWQQENAIVPVRGTCAYTILPMAKLLQITADVVEEEKHSATEELSLPPQQPQHKPPQQLNIQTGVFVIRITGKDFEIRNNSSSKVSLTIENDKVILAIK